MSKREGKKIRKNEWIATSNYNKKCKIKLNKKKM